MNQLGYIQAIDGFSQGIVIRVADATHGCLNAGV